MNYTRPTVHGYFILSSLTSLHQGFAFYCTVCISRPLCRCKSL